MAATLPFCGFTLGLQELTGLLTADGPRGSPGSSVRTPVALAVAAHLDEVAAAGGLAPPAGAVAALVVDKPAAVAVRAHLDAGGVARGEQLGKRGRDLTKRAGDSTGVRHQLDGEPSSIPGRAAGQGRIGEAPVDRLEVAVARPRPWRRQGGLVPCLGTPRVALRLCRLIVFALDTGNLRRYFPLKGGSR